MNVIKQIELIKRIDQLVRLKATGTPLELSDRLHISKTKLYRAINIMRDLGAPIEYDSALQSFVYIKAVGFQFGFYRQHTNIETAGYA
ncbi:HTH domain-containing protein [Aquimarina gracilis]|uniref:HTH domain-containing protein n=1 Tax=Aquimarina gracilis TaxID=874422 RepID=A0ABU5ZPR9_9FLAO|nr:HTH domain-containing protein [Aquimarina gracilis]MEB3343939.1 HTH domain-containing protein [Aquimarina gracilis]